MKLPKVGLRMIKSAIAVFICLVIGQFIPGSIPFYSAIAAVLCMQPYIEGSKRVAWNRTVGTLIGGLSGMCVLAFNQQYITNSWVVDGFVALCIIPLIYITILIKKPTASYITCVVFMSITINHSSDVIPYLFAFHRMLDTLLGIVVSLGINAFHLPSKKKGDSLYVLALDPLLSEDGKLMSTFSEIHLNRMLEDGLWLTLSTNSSPATFVPLLEKIHLNLPVIAMHGAILFDIHDHTYSSPVSINRALSDCVEKMIRSAGVNCFVYTVVNEMLHVYYGDFENSVEAKLYHQQRKKPHKSFVYGDFPENMQAVLIRVIEKNSVVNTLEAQLKALPEGQKLGIYKIPEKQHEGYSILDIVSVHASNENAIEKIKEALPGLEKRIRVNYPNSDDAVRYIEKIFYSRIHTK